MKIINITLKNQYNQAKIKDFQERKSVPNKLKMDHPQSQAMLVYVFDTEERNSKKSFTLKKCQC